MLIPFCDMYVHVVNLNLKKLLDNRIAYWHLYKPMLIPFCDVNAHVFNVYLNLKTVAGLKFIFWRNQWI